MLRARHDRESEQAGLSKASGSQEVSEFGNLPFVDFLMASYDTMER